MPHHTISLFLSRGHQISSRKERSLYDFDDLCVKSNARGNLHRYLCLGGFLFHSFNVIFPAGCMKFCFGPSPLDIDGILFGSMQVILSSGNGRAKEKERINGSQTLRIALPSLPFSLIPFSRILLAFPPVNRKLISSIDLSTFVYSWPTFSCEYS